MPSKQGSQPRPERTALPTTRISSTMTTNAPSSPPLYRPKPRRPFEHRSIPRQPPSPLLNPTHFDETPSRTHSILNLTSSTLGGIYSLAGSSDYEQPSTPWGTGAQTPRTESYTRKPLRRISSAPPPQPPSTSAVVFALAWRSILLFGMGMGYGLLVRHLHDDRQLAPFQVEGIIKPRNDWRYLAFWGIAGVALGSLMPWVDTLFEAGSRDTPVFEGEDGTSSPREAEESEGILGQDWTPVVRSVGAFVGIAYAIRKLPWTSSLQASLTLFMVNPALWYLIDRSVPGFILSAAVGAIGTTILLASNPDMMPSPTASTSRSSNITVRHHPLIENSQGLATTLGLGLVSTESVECGIWILSVLFCSCVCFGNIGRRLALKGLGRKNTPAGIPKARGEHRNGTMERR